MMMNFNPQYHQQQPPSLQHHPQQYHYDQQQYPNQQQQRQEPSAPPRRKRSLSTGRYDQHHHLSTFQDHFQDGYYYPDPMNSNFYQEYPQAAYYHNNINHNHNHNHQPNHFNPYPNGYPNSAQQFPRAANPLENLRPLLVNNQPSLLFAAMASPMSTTRPRQHAYTRQYSTPLFNSSNNNSTSMMGMISHNNPRTIINQNVGPVRPHYDLVKSTQIPYNPYQTKFTPTLMAKPSLEIGYPTQISNSVATAIARGRDSMYSSRERLAQAQQNPFDIHQNDFNDDHHVTFGRARSPPPLRPPPPKLSNSRLSMENLSSATNNYHHHHSPGLGSPGLAAAAAADYSTVDRSRRDRRSLSPTRAISPGLGGQRPFFTDGSRPTSPLSGMMNSGRISPTTIRPLSRTPSVNNNNNNHHLIRSSRTPSREPSPMRTFLNFASNSAKNLLTPKTSSNGRNTTGTGFTKDKSPSYTDVRLAPTSATKAGHFDDLDLNNNRRLNNQTDRVMDELQVPTAESFQQNNKHVQDLNRNQNHHHQYSSPPPQQQQLGETKQFSQAFTDHCDQYKSVTSKILAGGSKRNSARISGGGGGGGNDFVGGDVNDLNDWNSLDVLNGPDKYSAAREQPAEMYENQNRNDPRNNNNMMQDHRAHQQQSRQDDSMMMNPNQLMNDWSGQNFAQKLNEKLLIETMKIHQQQQQQLQQPDIRRNSSGNNLSASQRKASLPAEYIAKTAKSELAKQLPEDWSRENVAQLAHEARERKLTPQSKLRERVQKIGVWFTKQFIFLLVCLLNILLAYVFYNLMVDLPRN